MIKPIHTVWTVRKCELSLAYIQYFAVTLCFERRDIENGKTLKILQFVNNFGFQ